MQAACRLLTLALALLMSGVASAALVDDAKLAAAKRAADEFMRRVEGSATSGAMPRRSDPGVAALLDASFDNASLGTGVLPVSESGKLGELLQSSNRVGLAYLMAGTGTTDLASTDPKVLARADQNVATFAPEIGQWFDFQLSLQNALATSTLDFLAKAAPAVLERPNVKSGLANVRQGLARSLSGTFQTMASAGLDDDWRRARLAVIGAFVVTAAKLVTAEDAGALRDMSAELAGLVQSADVQDRLKEFGRRIVSGRP